MQPDAPLGDSAQVQFGALLRQFRIAAGLSQEALAERSKIGVDTVSSLERGINAAPYQGTVTRLTEALALNPSERAQLESAISRTRRPRASGPKQGAKLTSPAIDAADAPLSNLPASLSSLIGRNGMIGEIAALVQAQRHVSLVGSGGIGKTSVALHAGRLLLPQFSDGVWVVDLVPLVASGSAASGAVASRIAGELGLRAAGVDRTMQAILIDFLRLRKLLIIIDGCEHIIGEVAALVEAILREAPGVRLLATTREPLRTENEFIYDVGPLTMPDAVEPLSLENARSFGAIDLFVHCATAADRQFVLDRLNVALVAEICRRLDGIALAIEMAAAHVKMLTLPELAVRLKKQLPFLTKGKRTARPHHQTLRALTDWSYTLLAPAEQRVLHRVAIFVGGWTLDGAEHVCSGQGMEDMSLLEAFSGLVDKSLMVVDRHGAHSRYRLLEFVREYALEKLVASDEHPRISRRHAEWVAILAEQPEASWTIPRRRLLASILPDFDNVRAAIEWAMGEHGDLMLAARITADLGLFWYYCGFAHEGRQRVESFLRILDGQAGDELSAKLWAALSALTAGANRVGAAVKAIAIFQRLDDGRRLGVCYLQLAIAYRQMARFPECATAIDSALMHLREVGEERSTYYAWALVWRASALIGLKRFDEARAIFENELVSYDVLEDEGRAAVERLYYGELEFAAGNVERAIALVEDGLAVLRAEALATKLNNDYSQVLYYLNLAAYKIVLGNIGDAGAAARNAIVRARGVHYPLYTAIGVQHLATETAIDGNVTLAARLLGFVDNVYQSQGLYREPTEQRTVEILLGVLEASASEARIEKLRSDGAVLSEEEAVRLALEQPRSNAPAHSVGQTVSPA